MQMQSWKRKIAVGVALVGALSTVAARADVLEQKWQAGEQLAYDFTTDGTVRFTLPADAVIAGFPVGGLPLEMQIKGNGQNAFVAHEVDEFGTAVVTPRLERFQLNFLETTFNQGGTMSINNGRGNVRVNNQNVGPADMDLSRFLNPGYGIRFTKSLRPTGFQALAKQEAAPEPAPQAAPGNNSALPMGFVTVIQGIVTSMIPPFLPLDDISVGDTWSADISWPAVPGVIAPNSMPKEGPGKFNFQAVAQEELQGRQTWKIAVDGEVKVSDLATKPANAAIEQRAADAGQQLPFAIPNLVSVTQKVKGDIWFDAQAGRAVKADLRLNTNAESRVAAGKAADGKLQFNGKVLAELRKTAFAGE